MGCDNSKTVRVQPVGPAKDTQNPRELKTSKLHRGASKSSEQFSKDELDQQGNKVRKSAASRKAAKRSRNSQDLRGSCESLDDTRSLGSDRGFSATSKQSADSGLGEEYGHVITEFSDESKVKEVEKAFQARGDLDLGVTGVSVGTRASAKDRARQEEAQIMQSLRAEGLIAKPKVEAAGGLCFEIVDADGDGRRKPPPRLEKLALERRTKTTRAPASEEEIREKLDKAERRRKKREQERLDKLRVMERTDAVAALETFAQYQRSKEETIVQRLDQASDNKERKRREMKERLERRKRHAEEVRQRKQQALESGLPTPVEPYSPEDLDEQPPGEGSPRDRPTTPCPDADLAVPAPKWQRSGGGAAFRMRSPMMVQEASN